MVISHKYKYLFIEFPHTASTAIHRELCNNYNGIPILYKHAHYSEFIKTASKNEKKYFTFSCIRNPLDMAITYYIEYKTNRYISPRFQGSIRKILYNKFIRILHLYLINSPERISDFVKGQNIDFSFYFQECYKVPYNNWSCEAHRKLDYVIKYENLQYDFSEVLSLLGIKQIRSLPIVNVTKKKEKDFLKYYTPEIRPKAVQIFGPYMQKWGYNFPKEWGKIHISWMGKLVFYLLEIVRKIYYYFRLFSLSA